jgi:hypothetical protein
MNLYRGPDIVRNQKRSRRFGRVERISGEGTVKNVFKETPKRRKVCWKAKERDGHMTLKMI